MLLRSKNSSSIDESNIVWKPQAGSQEIFLDSPVRETLYAGTRGPGKTDALLMDFAQHVDQGFGPEWRGILFRESYPQLSDVIKKSKKWFPRIWPKAVYNKVDREWTFPNGEQLLFRHMNDPEDYWNYHGHAYPWIGWEELCNWVNDECYTRMMSCNRSTVKGIPRKIRATTNPYGRGHNWVRKRWHLPGMFGQIIRGNDEEGNKVPDRVAIHGSILENKILLDSDPEYISTIRASARNPQELMAWLHGSWDIVSGGAFDDVWNKDVHRVPVFQVPAHWNVFRSYDWGSSKPFSIGFWTEATGEEVTFQDGRTWAPAPGSLIRIDEWYGTKEIGTNVGLFLPTREVAQRLNKKEKDMMDSKIISRKPSPGPADNSIFDKDVDSDSIEVIFQKEGIHWEHSNKSPGSRIRGLDLIRQRLVNASNKEGPGIFIGEKCEATLELLPRLMRDEKNPDDVDSEMEDHFYDEIRYAVLDANNRYAVTIPVVYPR